MRSKRVLVPVTHPVGGIRTYLIYNFQYLHAAGFRFTFFGYAGEGFDRFKEDCREWKGTEFIEIPERNLRQTYTALSHFIGTHRFSMIHSQGLKIGTIAAAAVHLRRYQIPHLITLHDVIIPKHNDLGRFSYLKRLIAGYLTRRASYIIPVSHDCEENHYEYFPVWKRGPVQVQPILNGVDVDRINRSRGASTIQQTTLPAPVLGGFFGRLMPQKGFDIVLKALELLIQKGYGDRFQVVAVMDKNGYLKETLRDTAANPAVARMVRFIEAVPDITPLLLQTDVLLMPSRWEACPLLPMEALVLGTPVIGSDCPGLREVLRGTPAVMVPKESPEKLAEAIIAFIESPETFKERARNYVQEASCRFDVNAAAEKLLEIYNSFL